MGGCARGASAREDFGAFRKRMVCRVYYKLEKLLRETGFQIGENPQKGRCGK